MPTDKHSTDQQPLRLVPGRAQTPVPDGAGPQRPADPVTSSDDGATQADHSPEVRAFRDRSLAEQLRNLLLLAPVLSLHHNRARFERGERKLFEHIDPLYLVLSLFDFVTERRVVDVGSTRAEIIAHLVEEVRLMEPDADDEFAGAAARTVLDALENQSEHYEMFSLPYFDPSDRQTHHHEFRLINHEMAVDGIVRYFITREGITAYLAMLDVPQDVLAQAEELVIERLVKRGRYDDAQRMAGRSRKRTLELQSSLQRVLRQAHRNIEHTRYGRDLAPVLGHAREHISERLTDENALLSGLENQDYSALPQEGLGKVNRLRETLMECKSLHTTLHAELMEAPERYLTAQEHAFVSHDLSDAVNLPNDLLSPLLGLPLGVVGAHGARLFASLHGAHIAPQFDPVLLLDYIAQLPERSEPGASTRTPEFEAIEPTPETFPHALQTHMARWIETQCADGATPAFSDLLAAARVQGLGDQEQMCIAYLLIGSITQDKTIAAVHGSVEPGRFHTELISGTNARFAAAPAPDGGSHENQ